MDRKQSQFTEVSELLSSDYIPAFGQNTNKKISKSNLFDQIKDETQIFIYPTIEQLQAANLVADPEWPVYVRVEETEYRLYKITTLAASAGDIPLNNGATATFQEEYSDIGFVVGPSPSINNSIALFDGTTGTMLKNGPIIGAIGESIIEAGEVSDTSYIKINPDETVSLRNTSQIQEDLEIDERVIGPASSASDQVALFDGVTGKLIKAGQTLSQYFDAFLANTLYLVFTRKINTYADIATTPLAIGQIIKTKGHTIAGIGSLEFIGTAGSVTDNGGTQKNSATAGVYAKAILRGAPTIQMYGGGIGGNNQTAWNNLYAAHSSAYFPAGDYAVNNLRITKAFTLKTDGFKTRLVQNTGVTGTNQEISVITVAASDVCIEDIALVGTIATDTGEDRHGIRIDATTVPGGISKIIIGSVAGANMRGDIVVTTGSAGRQVSDFKIGNVFGFNIFRNGVSVVSGINGEIGVVTVVNEGLFAFDSEPDSGGGIVENIVVAGVRGRHCGIPAVTSVQRGITFGFVDLDWNRPQSTPAFSPIQESEVHGLAYRSTNGCHIEHAILRNFPESPIRIYKETGDEYVDNISFGNLTIENCLSNVSDPPCLIRAAGSKNIRVNGTLKYTCTNPSLHELILDGSTTGVVRLSVNRLEGNAPIGRYIAVDCKSSEITAPAGLTCLIFTGNCTFENAKWDVGIISSSSVGLITFISSDLKWNGSFKYADGLGTNFHTYELNCKASATAGSATTWTATKVDS